MKFGDYINESPKAGNVKDIQCRTCKAKTAHVFEKDYGWRCKKCGE